MSFNKNTQQIVAWALLPTEVENSYKLTISYAEGGVPYIQQYSLDYQIVEQYGIFKSMADPTKVPVAVGAMSSVDANEQLITVGCSSCNNGYGEILIYDATSGALLPYKIRGDP